MKETIIHGFKTKYEENAKPGIDYLLYDLDKEEATVFFKQAKREKFAKFEDDYEHQFTLMYNPDDTYTLLRRD